MALIPQIDNGLQLSQNRQKTLPSKTYKLVHDVIASKLQLNEPSVVVADFITLNDIAYDKFSMKPVGTSYQETRDEVPGTAVSGEDITITDAQVLPLHKFNVEGKSVQETREGYNLLPIETINTTINDVTVINNGDGSLTLNGTAKAYTAITLFSGKQINLSADTYLVSKKEISGTYTTSSQFLELQDSESQRVMMFGGIVGNVSLSQEKVVAKGYIAFATDTVFNNYRFALSLVNSENVNKPYEQYGASPSIEHEAPIESVGEDINLLKVTATTKTVNGITFTVHEDGSIIGNGTATADSTLLVQEITSYPANEYVLSDEAYGSSTTYYTRLYSGSSGYNTIAQTTGGSMKYTLSEDTDIRTYIIVKSGITLNNVIFKPKISKKAGAYSPYGQGSIEIYNCNKNLLNKDNLIIGNNVYGNVGEDVSYAKTDLRYCIIPENAIECKPNNGVTMFINNSNYSFSLAQLDENKKFISDSGWKTGVYSIKTSSTTKYLVCNIRKADNSTVNIDELKKQEIQLEKGETATEYVEHQSQTKALYTQQPFRAIGDVKDRFVKQNGVWHEEHKNLRYIFTGNEGWKKSSRTDVNRYYVDNIINTILNASTVDILCSHFKALTPSQSDTAMIGISKYNEKGLMVNVDLTNTELDTVDKFKAKLTELYNAGTPLYVDYVLETPTLVECTPEQVEQLEYLNSEMKTYEGINHITTTNEVKPTLSFTYNFIPALPSPEAESPIISTGDNINLIDARYGVDIIRNDPYKIDVLPNTRYTLYLKQICIALGPNTRSQHWLKYCDASDKVIKEGTICAMDFTNAGEIISKTGAINTPENCTHIRLDLASYNNTPNTIRHLEVKLVKGSSVGGYSPYGYGNIHIYNGNKNFLINEAISEKINGVEFIVNKDGSVTMNGTATADANLPIFGKYWSDTSKKILLKNGEYFTIGKGTANAIIYCRDGINNKNRSTPLNGVTTTNNMELITYVYIQVQKGKTVSNETIYPMIVKGQYTTGTFPEYIQSQPQFKNLHTQQPFRSIGDIRDRFVKIDGIWYEEHKIGEIILDGTQGNMYAETEIGRYDYKIPNAKMKGLCASTHFAYKFAVENGKIFLSAAQSNRLVVTYSEMKTLESMNAWLAKNQVIVDYELDKPLLIQCTPEQIAILEEQDINSDLIHIYSTDKVPIDVEVTYYSSKDVQMVNVNSDRIVGYADGLEAVKQSIFHILNVERYAYIIYNNNYGVELEQYIGADINYIEATIENTLKEALTYDLRIKDVKVQSVTQITHDIVLVNFICYTIYGDLVMEVNINV